MLRHPGAFTAPVPNGWQAVRTAEDAYLLTPAERPRGAELRLAVFPRNGAPLGEQEGADRLLELLGELAVDPEGENVAFAARYTAEAHRAFAWFPAYDADRRDVDCLAAVVVLPAAVVAATAMATPRRPDILPAAELLLASITGDVPGRGRRILPKLGTRVKTPPPPDS